MPTREQLESALRNADAAGDTDAAKKIANALKSGQFDAAEKSAGKDGSIIQDARNVVGELSAGANRAAMYIPDTFVAGIRALTGLDIKTPSEAIEAVSGYKPGQGGFMEPGMTRDAVSAAGEVLIPGAAGMTQVAGRNLATVPGATAEYLGLGSAKMPAIQGAATTAQQLGRDVPQLPAPITNEIPGQVTGIPVSETVQRMLSLKRKSGDAIAAGFKLDEAGNVVKDKIQQAALKSGVPENTVAQVATFGKATARRAGQMLDRAEAIGNNTRERRKGLPSSVIGDALEDRLKIVMDANKRSGEAIDKVANSQLRGAPIDVSEPVNQFIRDLAKDDIIMGPRTGKLDFSQSSYEGLDNLQSLIQRVVKRLYDTSDPTTNAYKVHTAKRFLDEQVSYGKVKEGLSGRMEGVIKRLRSGLDSQLDKNFPDYDAANTTYSETIGLLNDLQKAAGSSVDLTSDDVNKALGIMSRKVLTNYQSQQITGDVIEGLQSLGAKYGDPVTASLDEDILDLVDFDAAVRQLFPESVAPNAMEGLLNRSARAGADMITTGGKETLTGIINKKAGEYLSKDEKQIRADRFDALRKMLQEAR